MAQLQGLSPGYVENLAGNTLILISQKRAGVRGGGQGEYSGPAQSCCIELLWGSVGRLLAGPRDLSIFWVVRRLRRLRRRRLSCLLRPSLQARVRIRVR